MCNYEVIFFQYERFNNIDLEYSHNFLFSFSTRRSQIFCYAQRHARV